MSLTDEEEDLETALTRHRQGSPNRREAPRPQSAHSLGGAEHSFVLGLQVLLWWSMSGLVNSVAWHIGGDSLLRRMQVFVVIACGSAIGYSAVQAGQGSDRRRAALFAFIVGMCTGVWGLLDCLVLALTAGTSAESLLTHVAVLATCAIAAYMHHWKIRPGLLADKLFN